MERSTEDISMSLSRIEELLTRGHQLLYGDGSGEVAPASNTKHSVACNPAAENGHSMVSQSALVRRQEDSPTALKPANTRGGSKNAAPKTRAPRAKPAPATVPPPSQGRGGRVTAAFLSKRYPPPAAKVKVGRRREDCGERETKNLDEIVARVRAELQAYRRNSPLMEQFLNPQSVKAPTRGTAPELGSRHRPLYERTTASIPNRPPPQPRRPVARPTAPKPRPAPQPSRSPAPRRNTRVDGERVPIWERLYNDASTQQTKLEERRRVEMEEEQHRYHRASVFAKGIHKGSERRPMAKPSRSEFNRDDGESQPRMGRDDTNFRPLSMRTGCSGEQSFAHFGNTNRGAAHYSDDPRNHVDPALRSSTPTVTPLNLASIRK